MWIPSCLLDCQFQNQSHMSGTQSFNVLYLQRVFINMTNSALHQGQLALIRGWCTARFDSRSARSAADLALILSWRGKVRGLDTVPVTSFSLPSPRGSAPLLLALLARPGVISGTYSPHMSHGSNKQVPLLAWLVASPPQLLCRREAAAPRSSAAAKGSPIPYNPWLLAQEIPVCRSGLCALGTETAFRMHVANLGGEMLELV